MRKIFFLFLFLPLLLVAQKPEMSNKAVVNVMTYDDKGELLHSTYGFFCSPTADIIIPFHALKNAVRAEVIDAMGKRGEIVRIQGASSLYDVVRATTNFTHKKRHYLVTRPTPIESGTALWQTYYTTNKKERPLEVNVLKSDEFETYRYYTVSTPNEGQFVGCPLVDEEGRVVSIMQRNITANAQDACAIDVRTADSLRTTATSVFGSDFSDLCLPRQIPQQSEQEAFSYIYMVLRSKADSLLKLTAVNDFMATYPQNTDVYGEMANWSAQKNNFAAADDYLSRGIALGGEHVSDLYLLQSELMVGKVSRVGTEVYPSWNLDAALSAIGQAYALKPSPRYQLQQGLLLYAKANYAEAYDQFMNVTRSPIANSQTFLYASSAYEKMNGDTTTLIALLDSAVVRCAKPYTQEVLIPLFNRSKLLAAKGEFKKAATDLITYEQVAGMSKLSDRFYLLRSDYEKKARMYQQAIDDLTTAVSLAKTAQDREDYLLEKAMLYLQVNYLDEARSTAQEVLQLNTQNADAYKILGIVYGEKKQKKKAQECFRKAQNLGDNTVQQLIQTYK